VIGSYPEQMTDGASGIKNAKIGAMLARQLVTGFLAVIIPSTMVLGGVTVYSLMSLQRVNAEIVEIMQSREAAADLHLTLTRAGAPLGAYLLNGDQTHRARFEELIASAEAKVQSCASAACHSATQMPQTMVAALGPAIERLKVDGRVVFDEGPGAGAAARVQAALEGVAGMRRAVEPMLAAVHRRGNELAREAVAVRRRAWILTICLTGLIAVAGCVAGTVIARRISRPLSDLVRGIRRVMAGDWSYQAATGPGEIGELGASFNRMVDELRRHREHLEEQNRTLDARVRQRTRELREKEQALAQSEKLASVGLLAAGVAHELNNPLTSIVMNTHLLMEEVEEGTPLREELKRIDADAGRCRRIIEDLRSFARLRQLEKLPGEVRSVVEQALWVADHELQRRGVRVEQEIRADLPRVTWDADRMVQVLTNLLVNAAQAMDKGGRIAVRARCEQGWLSLEVEDNGPGIAGVHRTKIFDPFFTTKPDGTGLGLSISYGIVDEHDGRIEVESRTCEDVAPGEPTGTTMRVVLPAGESPV
jgi:signal transduction histidine kinase